MNLRAYVVACVFALTALTFVFAAVANAQNRGETGVGRGSAPAAASRPSTAAPLTAAECRGLGGQVIVGANHCTSGMTCSTEDRDGVLRGSCIDEVEDTSSRTAGAGSNTPMTGGVRGEQATVAAPLTRGECERLGGSVVRDFFNRCSRADFVCRRQGADGHWHSVCINERG